MKAWTPRAAPKRPSAIAAVCVMFVTTTGRRSVRSSAVRSGYSFHPRLGARRHCPVV